MDLHAIQGCVHGPVTQVLFATHYLMVVDIGDVASKAITVLWARTKDALQNGPIATLKEEAPFVPRSGL
tara:strand:+ start:214 stop:420 length:207 start_codon:yes stop_codon:yes gene_type:complete